MIKTDYFDVYRKYDLSFRLTDLRNTTLNVTLEQLQSLLKEQPETKRGLFYKHSKIYRLLEIVTDAQTSMGNFCDKEDCLDSRNKFERFWSASIRPFWENFEIETMTPSKLV